MQVLPFRPCVVAVFVNEDKNVLVGERADTGGWQFPQGGIDPKESSKEALFREMLEELGCDHFSIISTYPSTLKYCFPKSLKSRIALMFQGQETTWFLCKWDDGFKANLDHAMDKEFKSTKWISATEIVSDIIEWKQESYHTALSYFDLL